MFLLALNIAWPTVLMHGYFSTTGSLIGLNIVSANRPNSQQLQHHRQLNHNCVTTKYRLANCPVPQYIQHHRQPEYVCVSMKYPLANRPVPR